MRMPNLKKIYDELACNILIVGYRGFGWSEGTPSEAGIKLDAEAILEYAMNHPIVNKSKVFIFGRSLGGAVGI